MEFDELGQKVKDATVSVVNKAGVVAKDIGKKANALIEEGKLSSKIKEQENNINDAYLALGKMLYENNGEISQNEDVNVFVSNINEYKATILEYKRQIAVLRGEKYCDKCGAFSKSESKYCSKCGNEFKQEN